MEMSRIKSRVKSSWKRITLIGLRTCRETPSYRRRNASTRSTRNHSIRLISEIRIRKPFLRRRNLKTRAKKTKQIHSFIHHPRKKRIWPIKIIIIIIIIAIHTYNQKSWMAKLMELIHRLKVLPLLRHRMELSFWRISRITQSWMSLRSIRITRMEECFRIKTNRRFSSARISPWISNRITRITSEKHSMKHRICISILSIPASRSISINNQKD